MAAEKTTTQTCCEIGAVEDTLNLRVLPLLERLDERSGHQEKRIDRIDRRTAGISTLVAAVVAALGTYFRPTA